MSDPQLVTYADRLAGDLAGLDAVLTGPLHGAFGGVHILPFFTPIDGADAGFDPIDHREVDPRLGSWEDLARIAAHHTVMADVIVNHMSDQSAEFRDVLAQGAASPFAPLFMTLDRVFPDGVTEADLLRVYRPRAGLPLTRHRLGDGSIRLMWTTFTPQQIDIDVEHPLGWAYLESVMDRLAAAGVRMIRLDAVGYAIKRPGTSCFMIPETYEFVDRLTAALRARGFTVLVEVHGHHQMQIEIAARVDLVYDFALPALVLDALHTGDVGPLTDWIRIRPHNAINVLDTHDGIGIIDVGPDPRRPERGGLLPEERIWGVIDAVNAASDGTSRLSLGRAEGAAGGARIADLYQVNSTYFDAVGRDLDRYLLARVIQCLLPGIPQIYYVGLLGGTNDLGAVARTGEGREVGRHRYTPEQLAEAVDGPVAQALLALLRWRCGHRVFGGDFALGEGAGADPGVLHLVWTTPEGRVTRLEARLDLRAATWEITESGPSGTWVSTRVEDLRAMSS